MIRTDTRQLTTSSVEDSAVFTSRPLGFPFVATVFIVALALRLLFNFYLPHVNAYSAGDASEYLRNAEAMTKLTHLPARFWYDCLLSLGGLAPAGVQASIKTAFSPLQDLYIAGPVFSIFLVGCFSVVGLPFDANNWIVPVAGQCILSAFTATLISLIAAQSWDRRTGLIAGFLAAFYPAYIVNSGRLYSESFACFWFCAVLFLTIRGFFRSGCSPFFSLITGFSLATLQLTRSVMVVVSLAVIPITLFQQPKSGRWKAAMLLAAGFVLVVVPWMSWQKLAFGKSNLVVDRVSHYNLFIGNHTDSLGWLSFPYPDGHGIENESFPQIIGEAFRASPSRWMKLMLDKPARLFGFPWNDFRTPIGSLTFKGQVLIHEAILLLAFIGCALMVAVQPDRAPNSRQLAARILILGLLGLQCLYMLFITVPRYNLTGMALIVLLAAAGSSYAIETFKPDKKVLAPYAVLVSGLAMFCFARCDLVALLHACPVFTDIRLCLALSSAIKAAALIAVAISLWKAGSLLAGNRSLARALIVVVTFIVFPSICLPIRAHGRWYEWQSVLSVPGQTVSQRIKLSVGDLANARERQCYLMIDSDGFRSLSTLDVYVNGRKVTAPLIGSLSLVDDFSHFESLGDNRLSLACEYIFYCLTQATGISNSDLRQWFLIPIDSKLLASDMNVELKKRNGSETVLFGAYNNNQRELEIPSPTLYSWEKCFYGVENDAGLTDSRYDTKVALKNSADSFKTKDLSTSVGKQDGHFFIHLLTSPGVRHGLSSLVSLKRFELIHDPLALKPADSRLIKIKELPPVGKGDVWLLRLTGSLRTLSGKSAPAITLRLLSRDDRASFVYNCPWSPRSLWAEQQMQQFDYAFPVAAGALPGHLSAIEAKICTSDTLHDAINQSHQDGGSFEMSNLSLEIVKMPTVPIGIGHAIK